VSASNVQSVLSATHAHLALASDVPSRLSVTDPSNSDAVNDAGIGPRRGDLQPSDEFACLIRLICEGSGEFS
jgi:hypothetical protein